MTRKKLLILSFLGTAIVAATLLAAGLSELQLLPGRPFPLAGFLQAFSASRASMPNLTIPINLLRLLIACMWILIIISAIAFIFSPQIRKEVLRRVIVYSIWFMIIYGLIVSLQPVMSALTAEESSPAGGLLSDASEMEDLLPDPPDFIVNPPSWFVIGVSTLLIALLLGTIWFFWRLLSVREEDELSSPLELIAQEAQQALKNLQSGQDLKDTIMRCYADMSQTLSEQRNLHRHSGMTPREFEEHLAQSGLHTEYIQRLTRLFEGVRYGNKPTDPHQEQEAIACLTAIVQTYGQPS